MLTIQSTMTRRGYGLAERRLQYIDNQRYNKYLSLTSKRCVFLTLGTIVAIPLLSLSRCDLIVC
jgi:hypothetical protein